MDIEKQIAHWQRGAEEDMVVAGELLEKSRFRHGLFFAHLALEKALKAHVTRKTGDVPPRIHNLPRLASIAGLALSPEQEQFLARFDAYQMEGRYPDDLPFHMEPQEARDLLGKAKEVFEWLMARW